MKKQRRRIKKKTEPDKLLTSVKKEIKFLDVTLICLFVCAAIFIIYHSIMVYRTMYEPSSLIVSVFGFLGFECGCMASIQKRKMSLKDMEYKIEKTEQINDDVQQQEEIDTPQIGSCLPQQPINIDSIKEDISDNGNT